MLAGIIARLRARLTPRRAPAIPHGEAGIRQVGHRDYVGGLWETIGRLQFDFLVGRGLLPRHRLLDVGCGCLRGGVYFIAYLEAGHYFGLDKEPLLLAAGITEVGRELFEAKQPVLRVAGDFAPRPFGEAVDFALAQSVFTHLPAPLVRSCLRRVRMGVRPGGTFLATFFESERPRRNPARPHDHDYFAYTRWQMEE